MKPKPCVPGSFDLQKAIATVMFVIDRSGSMGSPLSPNSGTSKWSLLSEALLQTLPSVDQKVEMGALIFPSADAAQQNTCAVPSPPDLLPGLGHAALINELMIEHGPQGRTPTAAALDIAGGALAGTRAASSARALVLATDGAPNCNAALDPATCRCGQSTGCHGALACLDDQRTVASIAKFESEGIPTYVIGLGSDLQADFADVLNAMAKAGGRPRSTGSTAYYAVNSPEDLLAALTDVRDQVARCVYLSPSVPDSQGTIAIDLAGVAIPFDMTGANGWNWSNQPNGEITFSGAACSAVSQSTTPPRATVTCNAATTSVSTGASTSQGTTTSSSTGTGPH